MATRSLIAYANSTDENTSGKWIYCHYDGYLSGVGQQLFSFYKNQEDVKTLISLGDISYLGMIPVDPQDMWTKGDYESNPDTKDVYTKTYASRGETDVEARDFENLYDLFANAQNSLAENVYLYSIADKKWFYAQGSSMTNELIELTQKACTE